jgi:4'-phosphopantetheinyl transferase
VLVLSSECIDVWLAFCDDIWDDEVLSSYRCLLSRDELCTERRFVFPKDQVRYLVTRALVRTVLSRYSSLKPEQWSFSASKYGRPQIDNRRGNASQISFNISHTAGLIVLAVTCRQSLGIDVENIRVRAIPMDVASSFFSWQEVALLKTLPDRRKREDIFVYWTLKEAYMKAVGKGLSIPMEKVSFFFPNRETIGVSFHPDLREASSRWRFWQLRPTNEHLMAICARRHQVLPQALVVRKVIPLRQEELLKCDILRQSSE